MATFISGGETMPFAPLIWEVLATIAVATSAVVGICFLRVGFLLMRGDANEYERNRSRVGAWQNIIRGTVPTKYDGTRDDRLAAGVAIDVRNNRWVEQGRLSDEALQDVLAR